MLRSDSNSVKSVLKSVTAPFNSTNLVLKLDKLESTLIKFPLVSDNAFDKSPVTFLKLLDAVCNSSISSTVIFKLPSKSYKSPLIPSKSLLTTSRLSETVSKSLTTTLKSTSTSDLS